jgi:hypothetical protein
MTLHLLSPTQTQGGHMGVIGMNQQVNKARLIRVFPWAFLLVTEKEHFFSEGLLN